ncbi:heme ABC transporter permease CcmC [Sphingosinicella sp. BN140058]|uniref:heme ABC transporter permease CcmC n=1 Tax=Sphingosinicella sp. BN140058 TaxID=1892855 RepID=UPI001012E59E|nr:heme ABC transporter permease CcmC [Sphingosinicella sp. BN140058]QAY79126.1 heme ABC transporter permease [Sphingosinicella sp. BN140058]
MHIFANPARFLKIARPLTPVLGWGGALLILGALGVGLFVAPRDYLQGESVRIIYVHVPAAWLGMGGWTGLAVASFMQLVWRHPLAAVAARAIAVPGAVFAAICLVTGSLWGKPTWGTYWQWDARLTSMLILLFLYIAYIALDDAERERGGEGRIAAIFGLVGAINIPIIHYSVEYWNTLHQGQSISFLRASSSIDGSMLWPLLVSALGFTLLFGAIVLMRMRAALARQKVEARLRRLS